MQLIGTQSPPSGQRATSPILIEVEQNEGNHYIRSKVKSDTKRLTSCTCT